MSVTALPGDCAEVVKTLADASVDSVVTDPPYALAFMGKCWDSGETAFDPTFWREIYRVLKPGGHVVAFGGTRTYHRLVCAIEDAGFEVRDQLAWLFGSGFPKSHDVSKGIDKAAGAEREVVGPRPGLHSRGSHKMQEGWERPWMKDEAAVARSMLATSPATDAAREWQGWGTALKPAHEPIVLARKPLIGTVAANVLAHGTGAINIDATRVDGGEPRRSTTGGMGGKKASPVYGQFSRAAADEITTTTGRWPANVCHDGSDEVVAAFPQAPGQGGSISGGEAARFFYTAKADKEDRLGSKHPTVKPVDLMQWLVRLVTPKNGVCLDPFAGTGTTGEAAIREGCRAVLIEREPEYLLDIERRLSLAMAGPDARSHAIVKAKGKTESAGPLFEGLL